MKKRKKPKSKYNFSLAVILFAILGVAAFSAHAATVRSDFNGDGTINVFDFVYFRQYFFEADNRGNIDGRPGVDARDLGILMAEWGRVGTPPPTQQDYTSSPFVINNVTVLQDQYDTERCGAGNFCDFGMVQPGYLNSDEFIDYLIVGRGGFTAYDHFGNELWRHQENLAYNINSPGIDGGLPPDSTFGTFVDPDNDGVTDIAYADVNGRTIKFLNGRTGEVQNNKTIQLDGYGLAGKFHNIAAAKFFNRSHTGRYPNDVVVMRHVFRPTAPNPDRTTSLIAINGRNPAQHHKKQLPDDRYTYYARMRIADVNQDGRDDVVAGGTALGYNSTGNQFRTLWNAQRTSPFGHTQIAWTAVQIGDVVPNNPGLETVSVYYFDEEDPDEYPNQGGEGMQITGMNGYNKFYRPPRSLHSAYIDDLDPTQPGQEILLRVNNKPSDSCPPSCAQDIRQHLVFYPSAEQFVPISQILDTPWKNNQAPAEWLPSGYSYTAEYPRIVDWNGRGNKEILAVERGPEVPLRPRFSVHTYAPGQTSMGARLFVSPNLNRGTGEAGALIFDVANDGRDEVLQLDTQQGRLSIYFDTAGLPGSVASKKGSASYLLSKQLGNNTYNAQ